jgi:site-specific DNA recombinase
LNADNPGTGSFLHAETQIAVERLGQVNETEAATVRLIFRRYAELGSVALLKAELDRLGIVSKRREGAGGRVAGGQHFSRGALYLTLQSAG